MSKRNIKVLVVDDSLLFRETISRLLSSDQNIEVVGTAENPIDAMDKIEELKPDVLTLDVHMPKMNGIDFLKQLMQKSPMPVVVVSSVNGNVFDALNAGAVEFVTKPTEGRKVELFEKELIVKIKIASIARLKFNIHMNSIIEPKPVIRKIENAPQISRDMIIAIGASTGGTEAILSVLKDLPKDMPGIVVVQHMPSGFTKMYAERVNRLSNLEVKEAEDGDQIRSGLVLIAPGSMQMKVKKNSRGYYVSCEKDEKVNGHAPSVDVLFNSVAQVFKENAVGIILTGMGSDGAKGLLNMKEHGAYTIGQNEASCVVYGMPKVSYDIGAVKVQSDLRKIPDVLLKHLSTAKK